MKNIKLSFIIILSIILYSCEKTVDNVDVPQQEPKLVVHCYISPEDSIINAYVYLSVPIFSYYDLDNYTPVTNAIVKISDFSNEAQLLYNGFDRYTISANSFPILPGNNYRLSVSAPGYTSVEGFCKVPLYMNQTLQLLSVDSVKIDDYNYEYKYKTQFIDNNGEGDFYRIAGNMVIVYTYDSMYADTFSNILYPKYGQEYFSDKTKDGEKILSELNYYKYYYEDKINSEEEIISLCFILLTTDEHYYKFHKSLSNYTGDDPFSEPTIVYSNIENGLGVFGAYRKYVIDYY